MSQARLDFRRASRRTDPASSHEAEMDHTASGRRQTNLLRVLAHMTPHGGRTFREIASDAGLEPVETMRRLNDLRAMGRVMNGPPRTCSVSGRKVSTWVRRSL